MPEIIVTIKHEVGLHARPASLFVQIASQFKSDIQVMNGDCEGNAKSILSILTLGAQKDSEIKIHAEGEDAEQALAALRVLVDGNFEEPI